MGVLPSDQNTEHRRWMSATQLPNLPRSFGEFGAMNWKVAGWEWNMRVSLGAGVKHLMKHWVNIPSTLNDVETFLTLQRPAWIPLNHWCRLGRPTTSYRHTSGNGDPISLHCRLPAQGQHRSTQTEENSLDYFHWTKILGSLRNTRTSRNPHWKASDSNRS